MKLLQFLEATNPNVKVKKDGSIYNAYLQGRRVGQAQVYDYESDGMAENERYIWKSATHPDYTRKGVATELYNVIADDLESQGLKLVPSPDQQLSGDAYQFWKARDPESIKGHGTYKAEQFQHYIGREIEARGRPVVITRVGWSRNNNEPLLGVRFTDVPEGSTNSTGTVRMSDVDDQLIEGVLSSLVVDDQRERQEYQQFVQTRAGGDWNKGAQMYAAAKKRHGDDLFGDAARLKTVMSAKLDFGSFAEQDWNDYWLLSQHADAYPQFQQQALANIEQHLGQDNDYYRYLADRISCAANGTQKYGTQDICGNVNEDEKIELPDLEAGDELMVGKFKNRKATIKGFKKDKNNQPVAKTNKGDQQIFKGRVKKLMDEARLVEFLDHPYEMNYYGDVVWPNKNAKTSRKKELRGASASFKTDGGNTYKLLAYRIGDTKAERDVKSAYRAEMERKMADDPSTMWFPTIGTPEHGIWEVHFSQTYTDWQGTVYNKNHVTGAGDAFRVFATVCTFIRQVIEKYQPTILSIKSAVEEGNRAKLYLKMVDRFASGEGYKVHKVVDTTKGQRIELRRVDAVNESQSFDRTTTEMPDYDDLIKSIDSEYKADYFRQQKGKEAKMVDMSPDEYLQAVDHSFEHGVMSGVVDKKVQLYIKKLKAGETFPALTLDYSRGNYLDQEGRHRSLAAKAVGINSVPVLIVTPTPEEAEYRGITVPNLDILKTLESRPLREGPIKIGGKGTPPRVTAFMSDYNASTVSHPFRHEARIAMNREHNSGDDFAIIELRQDSRVGDIYISSIQSSRGGRRGNGAAGLKLLTDLADEHRVTLELDVEAFGSADDTLSDGQLRQWYKRAGFVPYGGGMVRYPYDEYYDS